MTGPMNDSENTDARPSELCARVRGFVNGRVIPAEPVLNAGGAAAEKEMKALQAEAKSEGLWALNLPVEIGGGGVPFL
ncbi:MAG: acyl-CoA dehydrogenase, partial [Myxococcota bacterium]